MDQIVKELHEAAGEGNVASLLNLLERDRFMLDRSMVISYGETPLHIAAMLGHLEFCYELLRRKPELAEELDLRRSSALHLASAKGFTEIVKLLVSMSPRMGFAFDEDGKIPIHVAAMKGRVEVLKELVDVQPDTAHTRVEMGHGETVLHLCVQYSQLEALRFLVEHLNDEKLVNVKDDNGNSILHLAVFDKQVQIINYLVQHTKIDMYAVNLSGLKAVDILAQTRRDTKYIEIYDCLHNHPSQSSNGVPSSELVAEHQKLPKSKKKNKASKRVNKSPSQLKQQTMWLNKQQNSLMIVASLIATMAFQATLSPPGGFWQEDIGHDNTSGTNSVTMFAGNSIYADKHPDHYKSFMIGNTVAFISSLSVILFLISGLSYKRKAFMWILMVIMWISISAMAYTYSMSVQASILDSQIELKVLFSKLLLELIFGWLVVMAFFNLIHAIRLISYGIRRWGSKRMVFMWTLVVIVWIAWCFFGSYIILNFGLSEGGYESGYVFIVVTIGWLALSLIFGLAIPVRFIIKIIMKMISLFRKMIKEVIRKSSRNQDSIIVV